MSFGARQFESNLSLLRTRICLAAGSVAASSGYERPRRAPYDSSGAGASAAAQDSAGGSAATSSDRGISDPPVPPAAVASIAASASRVLYDSSLSSNRRYRYFTHETGT